MTKTKLVNQINNFYAALATEEPVYNNCYITKQDLENQCHMSEVLYDLKENFFTHENALYLYRKVKQFMKKKKVSIIETTLAIIAAGLLLWAGISWIEVICKNLDPNPVYSPINFFTILF